LSALLSTLNARKVINGYSRLSFTLIQICGFTGAVFANTTILSQFSSLARGREWR